MYELGTAAREILFKRDAPRSRRGEGLDPPRVEPQPKRPKRRTWWLF